MESCDAGFTQNLYNDDDTSGDDVSYGVVERRRCFRPISSQDQCKIFSMCETQTRTSTESNAMWTWSESWHVFKVNNSVKCVKSEKSGKSVQR